MAHRSLYKEAAGHARPFCSAIGTCKDTGEARERLLQMAPNQPIKCSRALPRGGQHFIKALLSGGEYPFASGGAQAQPKLIAACLIRVAGLDDEADLAHLGKFAQHVSDRGTGPASGQLMPVIPWFGYVGVACGIFF